MSKKRTAKASSSSRRDRIKMANLKAECHVLALAVQDLKSQLATADDHLESTRQKLDGASAWALTNYKAWSYQRQALLLWQAKMEQRYSGIEVAEGLLAALKALLKPGSVAAQVRETLGRVLDEMAKSSGKRAPMPNEGQTYAPAFMAAQTDLPPCMRVGWKGRLCPPPVKGPYDPHICYGEDAQWHLATIDHKDEKGVEKVVQVAVQVRTDGNGKEEPNG